MPLYYAEAFVPGDGLDYGNHLRAMTRDKAKLAVRALYPAFNVVFYR
jgi:hypothetical protein